MPDRAARLQRQFGNMLRAERIARKLTQRRLAAAADLSLTYVGEIERGQRMVSLETIVRLGSALNLSASALLAKAGM